MHKSKFDKEGINEEHRGSGVTYIYIYFSWYIWLCKFNSFILLAYNLLYLHEDTSNISEWRWSYMYNVRVAFFTMIFQCVLWCNKTGHLCVAWMILTCQCHACYGFVLFCFVCSSDLDEFCNLNVVLVKLAYRCRSDLSFIVFSEAWIICWD